MNTATTTNQIRSIGTRGTGTWATIRVDDGTHMVTVYDGWGVVSEMTFSGRNAGDWADTVLDTIAEDVS